MSFVTDAEWARYAQDLLNFAGESAQQDVVWKKTTKTKSRWGEGEQITQTDITIKALVSYNHFRVWPINKMGDTGLDDREYCHLLINNAYLSLEGLLNSNNVFEIDRGHDRFVVNGEMYRPVGDTPASQAKSTPLYSIIILEKDIKPNTTHEYFLRS